MPAFFRLALTTVAVKSLLPNFPHSPPANKSLTDKKPQRAAPSALAFQCFLVVPDNATIQMTGSIIR